MNDAEYRVLDRLFFPEPFGKLPEETGLPPKLVAAALRQLVHQRMVTAMTWDAGRSEWSPTKAYNADDLTGYAFQITHRGLDAYQHSGKS